MAEDIVSKFDLTASEIQAGAEYTSALVKLGLAINMACWINVPRYDEDGAVVKNGDEVESDKYLAIITPWLDRVGSKAIYELLFKAYEASITPQEIDPFYVSLYSPKTALAQLLERSFTPERVSLLKEHMDADERVVDDDAAILLTELTPFFNVSVFGNGIYVLSSERSSATTDLRRFRRFKNQIDALVH